MNDFECGFWASSRQVAELLFGWPGRPGRVGGLLFHTHSEQRARASRGQQDFFPIDILREQRHRRRQAVAAKYTEDANRTRCKTLTASVEKIFLERVILDSRRKT